MIFLEGLGDVLLPCAAAIVVPGVLVAVIGSQRALLTSTIYALTIGVMLWLRAGGFFAMPPRGWIVAGGFLAAIALFVLRWWWAPPVGAVVAGAAAAWMWQPCVGLHLGSALTMAGTDPWSAMLPLVAYGVGLSMVPVGLGLFVQTIGARWVGKRPVWPAVGLGVLAVLAAGGWYEEAVARLVQVSVQ